ncbi:hypothetical protein BBJ28_00015496 [Nothophytophthora sp. Chile5]|nr:hypothetical protein BBJ28_00015496 [Nothophytophthora sp. Chile5]
MAESRAQDATAQRFWCHECSADVATRVDAASEEMCCQQCGGNFVEEIEEVGALGFAAALFRASMRWLLGCVETGARAFSQDDPPQEFEVAVEQPTSASSATITTTEASARSTGSTATTNTQTEPRTATTGTATSLQFEPLASEETAQQHVVRQMYETPTASRPSPSTSLMQFLSGAPGRGTRIMSSNGNPVEFYISESGDAGDAAGVWGALGGMLPMLAGNLGDYAFGNMSTVINQLMQNDPNRVRTGSLLLHLCFSPPASKEVVEKLPKVKITQSDVDGSAECPVCKDFFVVDDEVHQLPCDHSFHPDCILPWLKQHNSCPLCRFELPTDDPDYENRRRRRRSSIPTHSLLCLLVQHRAEAMAAYAEAIRLCYRIEDEATEATLVRRPQRIPLASSDTTLTRPLLLLQTSQLQKLQRHADALTRVESLATESTRDDGVESERRSFKAAFDDLATPNGLLPKNQLRLLAKELGTLVPLSDNEVDEIWKQVRSSCPGYGGGSELTPGCLTFSTAERQSPPQSRRFFNIAE